LEIGYINVRKSLFYLGDQILWLRTPEYNEHVLTVGSTAHCIERGDDGDFETLRWKLTAS
jgi:hypothetical protein